MAVTISAATGAVALVTGPSNREHGLGHPASLAWLLELTHVPWAVHPLLPGAFLLLRLVFGPRGVAHPDGRAGRRRGDGPLRHLRLALGRPRTPAPPPGR
ncbi:hypothetical protein Kpho01_36110 [Kitasatospora phosalacinea]|uniref:Uncharacterized protein n=1 Tax=Kitasatospora phosalacinea TaxID=2065 RepID=A0A9W6PIE3_9ACTN|nr:hypothetical protein Kpho01_36110 [Kitasatospora phosalacinea]